MLDLTQSHITRVTTAEALLKAQIATATKEFTDAEGAALTAFYEAERALSDARKLAADKRVQDVAKALEEFSNATFLSSADLAGQMSVRLEAHKRHLIEAEQTLHGESPPTLGTAPQLEPPETPPTEETAAAEEAPA